MKTITLNGEPRTTAAEDIATLAAELGFARGTALFEHNGEALRPSDWSRKITGGDRVEVLRIAAGG